MRISAEPSAKLIMLININGIIISSYFNLIFVYTAYFWHTNQSINSIRKLSIAVVFLQVTPRTEPPIPALPAINTNCMHMHWG